MGSHTHTFVYAPSFNKTKQACSMYAVYISYSVILNLKNPGLIEYHV